MNEDHLKHEINGLRTDLFEHRDALEQVLQEFGLPDDAKALVIEAMDHGYALGKMKAKIDEHMAKYPLPDVHNTMWRVIFENSIGVGGMAGELEAKDASATQPHYAKVIYDGTRQKIADGTYAQKKDGEDKK